MTKQKRVFNERVKAGARVVRSSYARFEEFRRGLLDIGEDAGLAAFAVGRTIRRNMAGASALRVTFGADKGALAQFIEVQREGKRVFRARF